MEASPGLRRATRRAPILRHARPRRKQAAFKVEAASRRFMKTDGPNVWGTGSIGNQIGETPLPLWDYANECPKGNSRL